MSRSLLCFVLLSTAAEANAQPLVLYTDLVAGPTSGGDGGTGAYLSIFGRGFGDPSGIGTTTVVKIGGVLVAAYPYMGPSHGRSDVQQITVRVGAIGNPTAGVPLPVTVEVNGAASNADHTFIKQPGDILYVDNVSGNDATAETGNIDKPWLHVQTPSEGGALGAAGPGDLIVIRGKAVWSDVGYDNRWLRFRHATGNAPTGADGHGYIALLAYPGEDVHYVPPSGKHGGIHGMGDSLPEMADWIVISGLHIESTADAESDGAPVNLQVASDYWRVVNNDLGPWPDGAVTDLAAGITGNGTGDALLGNHIHDIGGGTMNHGIYIDGDCASFEIAFNHIHAIDEGNIIQTYSTTGVMNGLTVHDNVLHDGGRYGLNIADSTESYLAWNNVIYDTDFAGVRINVTDTFDMGLYFNTICHTNRTSGGDGRGVVVNSWSLAGGSFEIADNILCAGPQTNEYFADDGSADALVFTRNLWFGLGDGAPAYDTDPVGDTDADAPLFTNAAAGDFSLLAGSPALDAAVDIGGFAIAADFLGAARPYGSASDVGAFERVPSCSAGADCQTPPACHVAAGATCSAGACVYAAVENGTACVGDGNACTADSCQAGACAHPATPGEPCEDGDECTGPDTCSAAGACTAGPLICEPPDEEPPVDEDPCAGVPPCDDGTPDDGTPDDGTPDDGTPDDGTPDDGTPDDGTPDDGTPDDGMPDDGTPGDGTAATDDGTAPDACTARCSETPPTVTGVGCACSSASDGGVSLLLAGLLAAARWTRARRRAKGSN